MNILTVKLLVSEPEYYNTQSHNKCDGITQYSNSYRNQFFKTVFGLPIDLVHVVYNYFLNHLPAMKTQKRALPSLSES
jgi:hypothetical protein